MSQRARVCTYNHRINLIELEVTKVGAVNAVVDRALLYQLKFRQDNRRVEPNPEATP